MKIKPLGKRAIIIPDEPKPISKFIDAGKQPINTGIIHTSKDYKRGDHVAFNHRHAFIYEVDGQELWIIEEDDIYGKYQED